MVVSAVVAAAAILCADAEVEREHACNSQLDAGASLCLFILFVHISLSLSFFTFLSFSLLSYVCFLSNVNVGEKLLHMCADGPFTRPIV